MHSISTHLTLLYLSISPFVFFKSLLKGWRAYGWKKWELQARLCDMKSWWWPDIYLRYFLNTIGEGQPGGKFNRSGPVQAHTPRLQQPDCSFDVANSLRSNSAEEVVQSERCNPPAQFSFFLFISPLNPVQPFIFPHEWLSFNQNLLRF